MVSTWKKKHQHKRQLSQLKEILNDFIIGNNNNASAIGNETLEPQTNGLSNNFGRIAVGENSASQHQDIEKNIDDKISKAVDRAVMTVENCMHDAILTAMDNVVIPRVKMAVRSITESSGRGRSSVVQNPDQSDITGNTGNTSLMSASSRMDLNVDQDNNDEIS